MSRVGIIILAAGSSSRMGSPKQLAEYRGKTLIRHAIETAMGSKCSEIIVVLGAHAVEVGEAINDLPIRIVENPDWEQGMGTSIRAGIHAAEAVELDGIILSLADQPLLTAAIFDRLIATWQATARQIVCSRYHDTVGVPVFFEKSFFPRLLNLQPAQGCKGLILANAEDTIQLECPEALMDIDTPGDLVRIQSLEKLI
jgi:molybdenum cofactor cytidylyltransferase